MSRRILVINSGSTSFKYKYFEIEEKNKKSREKKIKLLKENSWQNNFRVEETLKITLRQIGDLRNLVAIGHRVVHGGRQFTQPVNVTPQILKQLESFSNLAPLHNPYNLLGIKACLEYLPQIPNIAVFDTAFYRDLPLKARIYALPFKFYEEGFERYGFHGLSHNYVAQEASKKLSRPLKELKLITCHLGGGASITAINQGKAIDTSMGFTPLEGLVMMTRPGDLDPGFISYFFSHQSEGANVSELKDQLENLLNRESGIKGLVGTSDFQKLIKEMSLGNKRAKLAFDLYIYRIKKYIGSYLAVLGGLDALVFTGAIGSGHPITRGKIVENLKIIGQAKILVISTNEELLIAQIISQMDLK